MHSTVYTPPCILRRVYYRYLSGKATLLTVLMVAMAAVLLVLYTLLPTGGNSTSDSSMLVMRLGMNGLIGLCVSGGDYALTTVVVQVGRGVCR
jgi:hypothetical protein